MTTKRGLLLTVKDEMTRFKVLMHDMPGLLEEFDAKKLSSVFFTRFVSTNPNFLDMFYAPAPCEEGSAIILYNVIRFIYDRRAANNLEGMIEHILRLKLISEVKITEDGVDFTVLVVKGGKDWCEKDRFGYEMAMLVRMHIDDLMRPLRRGLTFGWNKFSTEETKKRHEIAPYTKDELDTLGKKIRQLAGFTPEEEKLIPSFLAAFAQGLHPLTGKPREYAFDSGRLVKIFNLDHKIPVPGIYRANLQFLSDEDYAVFVAGMSDDYVAAVVKLLPLTTYYAQTVTNPFLQHQLLICSHPGLLDNFVKERLSRAFYSNLFEYNADRLLDIFYAVINEPAGANKLLTRVAMYIYKQRSLEDLLALVKRLNIFDEIKILGERMTFKVKACLADHDIPVTSFSEWIWFYMGDYVRDCSRRLQWDEKKGWLQVEGPDYSSAKKVPYTGDLDTAFTTRAKVMRSLLGFTLEEEKLIPGIICDIAEEGDRRFEDDGLDHNRLLMIFNLDYGTLVPDKWRLRLGPIIMKDYQTLISRASSSYLETAIARSPVHMENYAAFMKSLA